MLNETAKLGAAVAVPVLFAIADNDSRLWFRCYLVTDPERGATPLEFVVARVIGADDEIGALAETFRAIGCPPEGRKLKVTREEDISAAMIPIVRRHVSEVEKRAAELRQENELRSAAERLQRDAGDAIPPEKSKADAVADTPAAVVEDPAGRVAENPPAPSPVAGEGAAESSAV